MEIALLRSLRPTQSEPITRIKEHRRTGREATLRVKSVEMARR